MFLITAVRHGRRRFVRLEGAEARAAGGAAGRMRATGFVRQEDARCALRLLAWLRGRTAGRLPKIEEAELGVCETDRARGGTPCVLAVRDEGYGRAGGAAAGFVRLHAGSGGPRTVPDGDDATRFADEADALGAAGFLEAHCPETAGRTGRLAAVGYRAGARAAPPRTRAGRQDDPDPGNGREIDAARDLLILERGDGPDLPI